MMQVGSAVLDLAGAHTNQSICGAETHEPGKHKHCADDRGDDSGDLASSDAEPHIARDKQYNTQHQSQGTIDAVLIRFHCNLLVLYPVMGGTTRVEDAQ